MVTNLRSLASILSSPDISLANAPLITSSAESRLNSDHLPIAIVMDYSINTIEADNKTFINFAKADWKKFDAYTW